MKVNVRTSSLVFALLALVTIVQTANPVFAQAVHVTGVEHISMNVPDAKQASQFFRDIFGFVPVTDLGPYQMTEELKHAFHLHSSASLPHIVMLRAGDGPNIELFEYKSSEASTQQPFGDDLGATHVAFYTDDIYANAAALRAKGVKILIEPIVNRSGPTAGETWLYFQTPWGSSIELVSYPQGEAYEKQKGAVPLWHPHRIASESSDLRGTSENADSMVALASRYMATLNDTDQAHRLAAIKELYSENCTIINRDSVLIGQPAVSNLIRDLQQSHPKSTFRKTDIHPLGDGAVRVQWRLQTSSKDGEVIGQDILLLKGGRITESISFEAPLPTNPQ